MKKPTFDIGLTLSGGGARGAVHIGALKAMEESGIKPGIISGTSSGAVVGGLYASGMDPLEILNAFKQINLFRLSNYAFRKPGIVDSRKFVPLLRKYLTVNKFEDLKIPLVVCTTKLLKGKVSYFHSGDKLIESILASAALPGVFTPVIIEEEMFVDGGIMDNLPVNCIRKDCGLLIAIDVNKIRPIDPSQINHTLDVIERSVQLAVNQNVSSQKSFDVLIRPDKAPQFGVFAMNSESLDKLFKIGYKAMKKKIPELEEKLAYSKMLQH